MIQTSQRRARGGAWAALALLALFAVVQLPTLGYGTLINDLPHVASYRVTSDVATGSGLDRGQLVGTQASREETLDLAMLRFKLYSVEADEIVSIIALARIRPAAGQFDPGFYQYGGAFLYPLGLWYFGWNRLGVLPLGSLDDLQADPQRMDRVWIFGRAFVLAAFALSAWVLFITLRRVAPPAVAALCLGVYLFCPASVAFSQVIKPHWYGLLWVNLVLLGLARAFTSRHGLSLRGEVGLGIAIGLAVGTATTFAMFSLLVWFTLVVLVFRSRARFGSLFSVPLSAILGFAASNPYYFLNWHAMRLESATTAAGWFKEPSFDPGLLLMYIDNALFTGLGVAATVLLLGALMYRLARGQPPEARWAATAVLLPVVIVAFLIETMATWHTNLRYVVYALPMALIFLAAFEFPARRPIIALVLLLTAVQAAPIKLAYFDENDPRHSTRLAAAAWIDANIPAGSPVCLGTTTPVPYDVPPFDLGRYRVNAPDCTWAIRVERETDSLVPESGLEIAQRFRPRLSPERFPLVFGHINPQITIYRRVG